MKKIYFTVTGTNHYFGKEFIVEMEGLGKIGYVANSHYSVKGESMSAGRMYDKIGDEAKGRVKYVLPQGILCELDAACVVGVRDGVDDYFAMERNLEGADV